MRDRCEARGRGCVPLWIALGRCPLGIALAWAAALFPGAAFRAAAQPARPLNFVVVLTDDQRFDTLWAMPIVMQEHAPRSVVFEEAVVSTPLCCPFRASVLAGGFLAHRTGVVENAPPNGGAPGFVDTDSLPLRLQQAGYATALFGKYMNQYEDIAPYVPPGWTAFEAELSNSQTSSYQLAVGSSGATSSIGTLVTRNQFGTNYYRDRTLAFIESHADEPFFVLMSVRAPHHPATAAPGDEALFQDYLFRERAYAEADVSDKPPRVQSIRAQFPAIAAQEDLFHRSQLRSLQAVDRAVGALYDRLDQLDLLESTVVVFASDNGYLWGEHGMVGKGEIYEEALRVPFMVAVPGVTPRSDDHMVAVNLDLPATLFELAGLPPVGDGRSLVPLLEGRNPPWRETLLIESWTATQSWSGLRIDDARGRWKYVENTRSFKELYDLERDPFELANLADQPAQAAFVAQLAAELAPQKGLASRTPSAPNGRVGAPYARSLVAWGGSPPYTWRLFEGTLPPGLQVGSSPALLSGTPRAAGTWSFVLEVADASTNTTHGGPQRYRQPLELRILAACADGVDNDGDGRVDYPADPGCANAQGYVENPRCNDGIDNDGDGKIDFDGNPPDPNCTSAWLNHEKPSTSCGLGFELVLVLAPLAWVWGRRRVGPAGVPS